MESFLEGDIKDGGIEGICLILRPNLRNKTVRFHSATCSCIVEL